MFGRNAAIFGSSPIKKINYYLLNLYIIIDNITFIKQECSKKFLEIITEGHFGRPT